MDKIDKLIESEGERFIGFWDDRWFIFFEPKCLDYKIAEASDFLFDDEVICTVGEYKKRLKQKNKESEINNYINKETLIDGAISKWTDGWPNIHCNYLYYSKDTNDYAVTDKYMIKPNSGKLNKNHWDFVCFKFEFNYFFNKKLAEKEVEANQKSEPELHKQQLLENYTGLAMQALIARGESKSGVKSLSREFAQAAIDSLNGVCDENTTE